MSGHALFFGNPLVPYDWELLDANLTGFFYIFTEAFLQRQLSTPLAELAIFRPGG
ncbi:hypothetical protein [Hymenobacter polaris]|uniref:hypothetical protein n=1 Tax=Hymenobacter polaris TaxID=2682546 RepID=UPI001F507953|nr:hypothetical protein [Hymenobacter polaris]